MSEIEEKIARLARDYSRYDEYVDIVSIFEWLHSGEVRELQTGDPVFERYPRLIAFAANGTELKVTPDFLLTYSDGSAIVGEIASISVHDNSVEKLARQLHNYDRIQSIGKLGQPLIQPKSIDVVWLVPASLTNDACKRLLTDRLLDDSHSYKPSRRPCIMQYSRDREKYSIARVPHQENGHLDSSAHHMTLDKFTKGNLSVPPDRFVRIKTSRGFMNDQPDSLYLATYLMLRIWPIMFGPGTGEATASVAAIVKMLQNTYGTGKTSDVVPALKILNEAGLARLGKNGDWIVSRKLLGVRGNRETHEQILQLIRDKAASPNPRRKRPILNTSPMQDALFSFS